jgi:hypothetical protein
VLSWFQAYAFERNLYRYVVAMTRAARVDGGGGKKSSFKKSRKSVSAAKLQALDEDGAAEAEADTAGSEGGAGTVGLCTLQSS